MFQRINLMATDIIHNGIHMDKLDRKLPYSEAKRDRILKAYRTAGGKMVLVAEVAKIPRSTLYALIKQEEELQEMIDEIDEEMVEDLKDGAYEALKENIQKCEQKAIEYAFEKEPRKRRGKTRINKSPMDKLKYAGLILGFDEEPDIE